MKRVCAWCGSPLDPESERSGDKIISHGICEKCLELVLSKESSKPMLEYLDGLPAPVLVIDADGTVVTANEKASAALGKDRQAIEGILGGDAIECVHAREPGGCGETTHCRTCAIRLTVTDTHETGRSHDHVPAYQDIVTPEGIRRTRFLISTQKTGDIVLLRVDEIG